jgi:hypothetical protein
LSSGQHAAVHDEPGMRRPRTWVIVLDPPRSCRETARGHLISSGSCAMDLKQKLMQEGMKLMSNPNVMKLMQDERVMKAVMGAMQLPAKVSTATEQVGETVAKTLNMATAREVKDLKRTIRKLEEQVETMKKSGG